MDGCLGFRRRRFSKRFVGEADPFDGRGRLLVMAGHVRSCLCGEEKMLMTKYSLVQILAQQEYENVKMWPFISKGSFV